MLSKAKYNILAIARDLKVVILPSRDKCLMHHKFITLQRNSTAGQKFISS